MKQRKELAACQGTRREKSCKGRAVGTEHDSAALAFSLSFFCRSIPQRQLRYCSSHRHSHRRHQPQRHCLVTFKTRIRIFLLLLWYRFCSFVLFAFDRTCIFPAVRSALCLFTFSSLLLLCDCHCSCLSLEHFSLLFSSSLLVVLNSSHCLSRPSILVLRERRTCSRYFFHSGSASLPASSLRP